jgi:hypothetical protein
LLEAQRIRFSILLIGLASTLILGCETAPPTPEDPVEQVRQAARSIDAQREAFTSETGEERIGDSDSRFTAYYQGDGEARHLVLIEESLSQGEFGAGEVRYYFQNDRLFSYQEDRTVRLRAEDGQPMPERREVVHLFFDADGALLFEEKSVDGAPVVVEPYAVTAARNHGALLRRLALGEEAPALLAMETPVLRLAVEGVEGDRPLGTYRITGGSGHMPAGGGLRFREAHIANMVAVTAHLCTPSGEEPRDGEWTLEWRYVAEGEGESGGTFLGLLPISCRSAVALREHFGATPPVRRQVTVGATEEVWQVALLSLDDDAKVQGFQEFVHSLQAQCEGDLCPGDPLPE